MSTTVRGSTGAVKFVNRFYRKDVGWVSVTEYNGTAAYIAGEAANLPAFWDKQIDESALPLVKMTVTSPEGSTGAGENEASPFVFELLGSTVQPDLFQHPRALALSSATIENVRDKIRDKTLGGTLAGDALLLYNLLLKGTTSYAVSQFILRRQYAVSQNYSTQLEYSNIEKVLSPAQLSAEIVIPVGFIISIDLVTASIGNPEAGYAKGWLKQSPTVSVLPNSRLQISQEYWLANWSTFIYAAAT